MQQEQIPGMQAQVPGMQARSSVEALICYLYKYIYKDLLNIAG